MVQPPSHPFPVATPTSDEDDDADWVSASDIGAYTYCARAYWLTDVKHVAHDAVAQARLTRGTAAHQAHGDAVVREAAQVTTTLRRKQHAMTVAIGLALLALCVAVILWIMWS